MNIDQNQILASLSTQESQRLALTPAELKHAQVLYEMGAPIKYVYFPFNAMVSLVTEMSDGKIIEVGVVGSRGMAGISALLGYDRSPERAMVQIANGGARATVTAVKEEFARGGVLQARLLKYAGELMRQMAQTAACNAIHSIDERLSRWLLMCHDQIKSKELKLTQEFISEMLAIRRPTVSTAAAALQIEGLINYRRGHITITDLEGLKASACECYRTLNERLE